MARHINLHVSETDLLAGEGEELELGDLILPDAGEPSAPAAPRG